MATAGATTRLELLGTPRLVRGDAFYSLPDSLPGYLVAYLGFRADWVPREQVATLLWPEASEEEAQRNLRVNLNRLRPQLRAWGIEEALVAERRRLRLEVESDTEALRAAVASGAWAVAARAVRGPFLDGVSFRAFAVLGEWARAERDAQMRRWREAVVAASSALEPAAALELAQAYLAHDALDENVMRVQLSALAALGRSEDARRCYDGYRVRLRAEVGVEPNEAFAALAQAALGAADAPLAVSDEGATVGREAEQAAIAESVAAHRFVTLIGLGGVGKTRLARDAMRMLAPRFGGGVLWIGAPELSGPSAFPRRVADALQLPAGGGADPAKAIGERLGAKPFLVVLDNAESLLTERAALLEMLAALLHAVPGLKVLVTSREPLKGTAEVLVRLEGLALAPADIEGRALESPAVQLFVAQARRARPGFDPRAVQPQLAKIARLTGGMPLALRLAAAWIRILPVDDIVAELERGLDLLETDGSTDGVRASIERSWERLGPRERTALAALGVFETVFTPDAAREVAAVALPVLAVLAERSLLATAGTEGRARFELHPLIRRFALERLRADRTHERAVFDAHALYVGQQLATQGERLRSEKALALREVTLLLPEALAAWRRAVEHGDVDFVVRAARMLCVYFEDKGLQREGEQLFTSAEAAFDADSARELAACAAIGRARATLLFRLGDNDEVQRVGERALGYARRVGHAAGIKACLNLVGLACWMQGRIDKARPLFSDALALARDDGDRAGEAVFAGNLALMDKVQGDLEGAERGLRSVIAIHKDIGNWSSAIVSMNNLGDLLRRVRRLDEGQAILEEGLRLSDEHGLTGERPVFLINLAQVHRDAGRAESALTLAELALVEARRDGDRVIESASGVVLADLALARGDAVQAATSLREALRIARAAGDIANHLEALVLYGRICARRGEHARAVAIWHAVSRHPQAQSDVRRQTATLVAELGRGGVEPHGELDVVVVTEQALAELSVTVETAERAA